MESRLKYIDAVVDLVGLLALLLTFAEIMAGIARGLRQPTGAARGWLALLLGRRTFYLVAGGVYVALAARLWRPLPACGGKRRRLSRFVGTLLYFPGLGLVVWSRRALGSMYGASTGFGARLYAGHRLITHGPYALVRHPLYLGLYMTAVGGILLYHTWTFVMILISFVGLPLRAQQEDALLAETFGPAWQQYARDVPGWLPRLR